MKLKAGRFKVTLHFRIQGDRSWQPFGEGKNAQKIFVRRVFAIFATNASFLRVISNLQILFSIYHVLVPVLNTVYDPRTLLAQSLPKSA